MSTVVFSIRESIKAGWNLTIKHFWLLVGSFMFMVAMQVIPQAIMQVFFRGSMDSVRATIVRIPLLIILGLLFYVINLVLQVGSTKMNLKIIRHEPTGFKELFTNNKYLVNFFLASLLYGLVILLAMIPLILIAALFGFGFLMSLTKSDTTHSLIYSLVAVTGIILAAIPAAYFSIKYEYFSYFLVDHNLGPVEAFKKSAQATRGIKLKLLVLPLALALVNLLGFLAIGIGLLVSIPITILANAYVYNVISKRV